MNDLQLSLIVASGVAVAGVFAFNKWQEGRDRKLAEGIFSEEEPDVLLEGRDDEGMSVEDVPQDQEDHEPALGVMQDRPVTGNERIEPRFSDLPPFNTQRTDSAASEEPSLYDTSMTEGGDSDTAWEEADWQPPETEEEAEVSAEEAVSVVDVAELIGDGHVVVPETGVGLDVETQAPVAQPFPPDVLGAAQWRGDRAVPRELLNPDCDAGVYLELSKGKSADEICLASLSGLKETRKPVFWLGWGVGGWRVLKQDTVGLFRYLWLVIQLADRRGPVDEADITALTKTARNQGEAWEALTVDVSDLETATLRGRLMDKFCMDVDLQISVNLVGQQPFSGTKLRALAEAAGMVLSVEGDFVRQDDEGFPQFIVINQEGIPFTQENLRTLQTSGLTFILDVPRVSEVPASYDLMLRLTRQFAEALHADIVDDHRKPLTSSQLALIRDRFVVKPQAEMLARRIVPGSPLARRLFS